MRVFPIPRHLLIHTVTYDERTGSTGWNDTNAAPITIERVRVHPKSVWKLTGLSMGQEYSHVLLVDRVHSSSFPDFKENSKVTWNGKTFSVTSVNEAFDGYGESPHHYEIGLN